MEQFDRVWDQLKLYVREGEPEGRSIVHLTRVFKGTHLSFKPRSQHHRFFWDVAVERFFALTVMQDQSATVKWAQEAFQKLEVTTAVEMLSDCTHFENLLIVPSLSSIKPGPCCRDAAPLFKGKCWACFVKSPGDAKGTSLSVAVVKMLFPTLAMPNFRAGAGLAI